MSEYFPKPKSLGRNMKVQLDLSNYAPKADFKIVASVNTSKFAKKVDLASIKSEIDKLDITKLETTPADLEKLSDILSDVVVKEVNKDVYNELIKKVNAIQTTDTGDLVKS